MEKTKEKTEVKQLNIYEKLQNIRCELQKLNLKKSGYNKFAGYHYYELQDFLPAVNELMLKLKITSVINYYPEYATLALIDCENINSQIVFQSPMAKATLKGCHEVQNLGATETYLRRYLYVTAFEIIEHDMLDVNGIVESAYISKQQLSHILDYIDNMTIDMAKFLEYLKVDSLEKIPVNKYNMAMLALKQKKEKGIKK